MAETQQYIEIVNGSPYSFVEEKGYNQLKQDRVITITPYGAGTIRVSVKHLDGPPKIIAEKVADTILPLTLYGVGYTDIILENVSGSTFATIAASEN